MNKLECLKQAKISPEYCVSGSEVACQALLRAGADVCARDLSLRTPLHVACEEGHILAAQALLETGAPAQALDGLRRSGLRIATEAGHTQLCELLLQFGADPSAGDLSKGVPSPLAVARRLRNAELAALFQAAVTAQAASAQSAGLPVQLPAS